MRLFYILLFFSSLVFAQNPSIKLEIDSITSLDSIPTERTFAINYHIENLTDNEISFFLNPKEIISNSRASMSRFVIYKIFQNNETIDIDNIFGDRRMEKFISRLKTAKTEAEKKVIIEEHLRERNISIKKDIESAKNDENYFSNKQNQDLLSDVLTLKPKENKIFTKILRWDKTRYFKIDDNEYYLDENTPHYFELSINLMKEQFKNRLNPEEFEKIMNNPNFIQGWFTSNKMEINFRE